MFKLSLLWQLACSVCYMMAFYTSVFTLSIFPMQFINLFLTFGFQLQALIMKRYTPEEYQTLLKDAQNKLKNFTAETLIKFQTSLDNLPDKYKKERTWDEYEKAKKLVSDFIYTNYSKTEEILFNGSVFYTVETAIFFNLVCEIPAIDIQFEEVYKSFLQEAFPQTKP